MSIQTCKVAVFGLGTVGCGVLQIFEKNADILQERTGAQFEVIGVSARTKNKERPVDINAYPWFDDPLKMVSLEGVDVLIEVVGGSSGIAKDVIEAALSKGIAVVTANKALMALHGRELARIAEDNGTIIRFEAAVAGGIPIIQALKTGFAANKVRSIYGILNGTCNYILTNMRETGRAFETVLKEAQDLGYAEADPTFDVDGIDAAHKIALLAALSFGRNVPFEALSVRGIRALQAEDIQFASEFGYKIKLLGIAKDYGAQHYVCVEPCLVPVGTEIAAVEDVFNAVQIDGDFVGAAMLTGRGAGAGPTASAVVSDLIAHVKKGDDPSTRTFNVSSEEMTDIALRAPESIEGRFYMRINVLDEPGVLADVAAILRDHGVSVETLVQKGRNPSQPVCVMIVTHSIDAGAVQKSAEEMEALSFVQGAPCILRIEDNIS